VQQRLDLTRKGGDEEIHTHQLTMTATPIPRTLAMSMYAHLDYSVIDELPPGRKPITTVAMSEQRREEIIERINSSCRQGAQAYWVCSLIEESESLQSQAAEDTHALLEKKMPALNIGLLHGRMKSVEKEKIMQDFHSK
jgi:ATP-dependent DNA helicase RecG